MTCFAAFRSRGATAIVAAVAVYLAQALLPLAPIGMARGKAPQFVLELCTATGIKRVAVDSGLPEAPDSGERGVHCPLCTGPLLAAAIAPVASLLAITSVGKPGQRLGPNESHHAAVRVPAGRPRAPPHADLAY